jgi:beta-galactosidase
MILCEYSHAMGNSNGTLADHYAAFEQYHGLQGALFGSGLIMVFAKKLPICREYWPTAVTLVTPPTTTTFVPTACPA